MNQCDWCVHIQFETGISKDCRECDFFVKYVLPEIIKQDHDDVKCASCKYMEDDSECWTYEDCPYN